MSATKNETARIEAFSDGVIAIAVTLLILEIKVPHAGEIHSIEDLKNALLHLWPSYFSFVYSFGTIFVAWVNHHEAFAMLAKPSRTFMWANGFLLMTLTILPFPTAVLAEYLNTEFAQPAIVFFCACAVLHNLGWIVFMEAALHVPGTIRAEVMPLARNRRMVTYAGGGIYLGTMILAFWFPIPALVINSSLWFVWIATALMSKENEPAGVTAPP